MSSSEKSHPLTYLKRGEEAAERRAKVLLERAAHVLEGHPRVPILQNAERVCELVRKDLHLRMEKQGFHIQGEQNDGSPHTEPEDTDAPASSGTARP